MKDQKISRGDDYERIRQVLRVEGGLSVRKIAVFCSDVSLLRIDFVVMEMARLGVIGVERGWKGMRLEREEFFFLK